MHSRYRNNIILPTMLMATLLYLTSWAMAGGYRVSGWMWVTIMNPDSPEFFKGRCGIDETGKIQSLGNGLAEYWPSSTSGGTECGGGTIFEASLDDLKRWTQEYHEAVAAKAKRRADVCKKLGITCEK